MPYDRPHETRRGTRPKRRVQRVNDSVSDGTRSNVYPPAMYGLLNDSRRPTATVIAKRQKQAEEDAERRFKEEQEAAERLDRERIKEEEKAEKLARRKEELKNEKMKKWREERAAAKAAKQGGTRRRHRKSRSTRRR